VSGSFEVLEGHRYVRMITYRKSGAAVPTTVWFALADGRAYVFTALHSGKVKRLRDNPRVILTPSNFMGGPKVESNVEAEARRMEAVEEDFADRAIGEKYG
jgi:uncharacterized protein